MDPQHVEFPAQPPDPDRVRRWFATWVPHPDAGGIGVGLYGMIHATGGETIRLTVTRPRTGRVRLAVYGRRPLPPDALRGPGWARLLVLADAVGATADGAGAWAELLL